MVAADLVEQVQGLAAMCCHDGSGVRAGPSRASRGSLRPAVSELEEHPSIPSMCSATRKLRKNSLAPHFGGSKEEIDVSQYISSLSKLRKRVKETQCRRRRRRRRRKGFKVKQPSRGFLHEEGPTTLDPAGSGDTRNSKFLAYYSWLRSARGVLLDGSSVFKSLFPCHLPYPEVVNSEGVPTIGSVGQAVPQLLYCLV